MERDDVRELARQVAELAASPQMETIRRRWRDVNALRKPDRAPVWCRPAGAWADLLPEESLLCTDPWLREVERELRKILIKHEIGDDSPVDPWFLVRAVLDVDPPNTWGVDVRRHMTDDPGGSWAFDPPLKTSEDFERLCLPRYTYNVRKTEEQLSRVNDLLGDILPARLICYLPIHPNLVTAAADLRGLGQLMLDMIAEPALVHRLMAHVRDAVLGCMRQVEEQGLLMPNHDGTSALEATLYSEPLGPERPDGKVTYQNLWGYADSQEFDQVSPRMWKEFCLTYQRSVLEQFGLISYGCCENLTRKIDGVLSLPNLRVFICSAWTDLDKVIEKVGARRVIMWRQKASEVVFAEDPETLRPHLESGMRRLQGCYVQIVLRELQTLGGHLDRLHVWARLAKEVAEKYS